MKKIIITIALIFITSYAQAAVSFVSAGTVDADTTTACAITPGPPTHLANDILVAVAWNEGGSAVTTATAGWAKIADGAGTADATWWWKRAAGAGTAGPDFTSADTDCYGIVYIIRGAWTGGTPYVDATPSGDGGTTDTTPDTATVTTTNVNQMVFSFMAEDDDIAFASGNPPTLWNADSNVAENAGTDASFHVISRTLAAAGDATSVAFGTFAAGHAYWALTLAFIPQPVSALTGTITASVNETDIVTGGKTLIITLTDDNWIAAGVGSFDLQRDEIIAGVDSAQGETLGWNLVPQALQSLGGVIRTSDTVVTITWDAFATYDITATETITNTVPSTATVGAISTVSTPTFDITTASTRNRFIMVE